jgi:hypothetical protein
MSSPSQQLDPDEEAESPQSGTSRVNHTISSYELKSLKKNHDLTTSKDLKEMTSSLVKRGRGRPGKHLQSNGVAKPVPRSRFPAIQPAPCKAISNTKISTASLTDAFSMKGMSPQQVAEFLIKKSE